MTRTYGMTALLLAGVGVLLLNRAVQAQATGEIPADRQAQLLERYPDADTNGDGKLTRAELRTYRQAQAAKLQDAAQDEVAPPPPPPPGDAPPPPGEGGGRRFRMTDEQILERRPEADTDGDGKLSPEERDAVRAQFAQRGGRFGGPGGDRGPRGMIERVFGFITQHFAEADADGNGQLSREELMTLKGMMIEQMPAGPEGMGPGGPGGRFAGAGQRVLEKYPEADSNGDGRLDREEFEAWREANPDAFRQGVLERFPEADSDGDGTLSQEEFDAFRAERQGGRGDFGPRGGDRGERGERGPRGAGRGPGGGPPPTN